MLRREGLDHGLIFVASAKLVPHKSPLKQRLIPLEALNDDLLDVHLASLDN